jgi:SAM-dependent methyltransferase
MVASNLTSTEKPFPVRILDASVPWAMINPATVRYIPCLLCGLYNYVSLASLLINGTEFFLVRCNTCELIWRTPIPNEEFLQDLYSEEYYRVNNADPELVYQVGIPDTLLADRTLRETMARAEINDWLTRKVLPQKNTEQIKFLEIGGGGGYLQQAAAERGWETLGIEISNHAIKQAIAKGLIVLPITLDELYDKYIPYLHYFDLVVLFDFLEHVPDPGQVLRIIRKLLDDGGIVIFRIPLSESCPSLHLIDHIWHFSHTTVEHLLEKEGFQIIAKHDSGQFRSPDGKELTNVTVFVKKRR